MKNFNAFLHKGAPKKTYELESMNELIIQYKQRGYKIPYLSTDKELFKIEPLLEKDKFKMMEGLKLYPTTVKKNVDYIYKMKDIVASLLNHKTPNTIEQEDKRSLSLENMRSFEEEILNNKLQKRKKNVTLSTNVYESGSLNESHNVKLFNSLSSNNITIKDIKNENKILLQQIQKLLLLIEDIKDYIPNQGTHKGYSSNKDLQSVNNKSENHSPVRIKQNRGSLFNPKIGYNKLLKGQKSKRPSQTIISQQSLSTFKTESNKTIKQSKTKDTPSYLNGQNPFLEYALQNLKSSNYSGVLQILKLYLMKFKNINNGEPNNYLFHQAPTSQSILKTIEKTKIKLFRDNITEKSRKMYSTTNSYSKHLKQIRSLSLSDESINQLDRELIKKLTYRELKENI